MKLNKAFNVEEQSCFYFEIFYFSRISQMEPPTHNTEEGQFFASLGAKEERSIK